MADQFNEYDRPTPLKEILWHRMRNDLKSLVPWFADNDLLLCPTCCRPLRFDEFSLEHIIPRQALASDPSDVRVAMRQNERSEMTLLCSRPLIIKGKQVPGHGCNSWKGNFYDTFLRELLRADFQTKQINSRHEMALFSARYLGLFRHFGYQIALLSSGLLMRNKFFHPNSFLRDVPLICEISEHVAADGPFPLIDALVDGLDLKSARFKRVEWTCASAERALCLDVSGRRRRSKPGEIGAWARGAAAAGGYSDGRNETHGKKSAAEGRGKELF